MSHWLKRPAKARVNVLLLCAALTIASCADILGFERGQLAADGGAGTDASTDGRGGDAARGGADASTDSDATGGAPDSGNRGGTGGSDATGGGTTGGTGGGRGGNGGTGVPDASGGASGAGTIDASPDRGPTCGTGQKLCGSTCIGTSDPATGCAETACTPCAFPNATTSCDASGKCAVGSCTTGFDNCNSDLKDGCETDLSKADTCGSCLNKCDATAPLCSGSNGSYQCVTGCMAPTSTLCGSQCVNVDSNASHCGGCMMSCPPTTNGDPVCTARSCDFTCHNGYHRCMATQTCASNTDINACGATCKKCDLPANGKVACTAGDCLATCNTNYHLCTVNGKDTCADDNSPATCGTTSCTACPAPTDPNADPAPTCVNKQCGLKCKTGFNLCSGVCSDTNSVLTCGPSCTACTKPANASTVTCNGTSCGFTCNPGYEPSGLQCVVATNLYVSTTGSDTNAGTQASPFRTWKRASQLAQSGTIVNFAAGTYDGSGGDDFSDAIPNGVTLQRSSSGIVTFTADGLHSLVFAGSGTLQNVTLTNFRSPLSSTAGTQTIKGVTVNLQFDPIHVSGSAIMVVSDNSVITGTTTGNQYLVRVDSTAQLTMRDTVITGTWGSCFGPPVASGALLATDSATVSLVNLICGGILAPCVLANGMARVGLTSSTLLNECERGLLTAGSASVTASNTSFADMEARESSSWSISGGTVRDTGFGVGLNGTGSVSFRDCTFGGINGVSINTAGATYDFGTTGTLGNNRFNSGARDGGGLNVWVDGVTVQAHGNKWVPNVQGADASGNMPSIYLVGPVSDKNVSIGTDQSGVDM
jgi:hypothetical protein